MHVNIHPLFVLHKYYHPFLYSHVCIYIIYFYFRLHMTVFVLPCHYHIIISLIILSWINWLCRIILYISSWICRDVLLSAMTDLENWILKGMYTFNLGVFVKSGLVNTSCYKANIHRYILVSFLWSVEDSPHHECLFFVINQVFAFKIVCVSIDCIIGVCICKLSVYFVGNIFFWKTHRNKTSIYVINRPTYGINRP